MNIPIGIPFKNLTIQDAIQQADKLAEDNAHILDRQDPNHSSHYRQLSRWLRKCKAYEDAIYTARVAFADADREIDLFL